MLHITSALLRQTAWIPLPGSEALEHRAFSGKQITSKEKAAFSDQPPTRLLHIERSLHNRFRGRLGLLGLKSLTRIARIAMFDFRSPILQSELLGLLGLQN